jgi:hypothetical protein
MKKYKVKPNYNRQKAIEYLERWFDDWVGEGDWWGGAHTWDINVFTDEDWEDRDWVVNVFGLEQDEEGGLHTRTETDLDLFEFKLTKEDKGMKEYYFKIESTGIIDAKSLVEAEAYVKENALALINDDAKWLEIHVEPEDYENFDEVKE